MAFADIAIGVGVASGITGIASAAGAFSQTPNYGDPAKSSAAMADATASNLPETLRLQAAAQEGGTVLMPGYTNAGSSDAYRADLQSQIDAIQAKLNPPAPTTNSDGRQTGGDFFQSLSTLFESPHLKKQLADLQGQLAAIPAGGTIYKDKDGNVVPESKAVANFAGNSTADIQGRSQQQLAQGQLDTAKQYDSQFIAQRLAEEKQANPQGVAARQALYNDIQQAVNNPPPVSPVATTMDKQINDRVAAGSGLTPEEQATLDAAVNGSTMTGTSGNTPNLSGDLTTGFAGEQRALQNAGSGATWLASGQTPADVQYREQQQGLSDLSSYISGQTPQSQFGQLSGAQSGPTPNSGTNYLPSFDSSAAQMGAQGAVDRNGQLVQQQLNTPNLWTSGLSMAINGVNARVKSGLF